MLTPSRRETPKKASAFHALLLLVGAVSLGIVRVSAVSAADVPPSRQAVIVLRALAYDGNLKNRAGPVVNIAIVHKKGNSASEQMGVAVTQAFISRQSTLVIGLPIAISRLAYRTPDELKDSIVGSGIDVLYVCDGLEDDLDAIKDITRQTKVLSVGANREQIEKGLSLGVVEMDGKVTILVNLQGSRLEGVSFTSDLLRLASVIR
jgi:YfiR/HmsC-like